MANGRVKGYFQKNRNPKVRQKRSEAGVKSHKTRLDKFLADNKFKSTTELEIKRYSSKDDDNYIKQLRHETVEQYIKQHFPSKSAAEISEIYNWLDIYHFSILCGRKCIPLHSELHAFLKDLAATLVLPESQRTVLQNNTNIHLLPNGKEKLILAKKLGII